jgi:5'-nucleotidase
MKKRIFVDMDGTLCDFRGALVKKEKFTWFRILLIKLFFKGYISMGNPNKKFPQSRLGFFLKLEPLVDAIDSFNKLKENYDVWILTRPSFKNVSSYSEKAQWVLDHLGYDVQEKTIMCGDKSLLKGDYLIDDEGNAGQERFEGEWLHFGKGNKYPDWKSIMIYLNEKSS